MVKNKHLTIINIIVASIAMIILTGFAVSNYGKIVENSKKAALKRNLTTIRKVLFDFYTDTGRYAESLTELTVSTSAGPYLMTVPIDPTTGVADWVIVASDDSVWPRQPENAYNSVKDVRSSNTEYNDL